MTTRTRSANIGGTVITANGITFPSGIDLSSQSNAAYGQANTARDTANSAYGQANTARDQANTARSDANATFAIVNSTFSTTNTSIGNLNSATSTINSHLGTINTTFGTVNTAITNAHNQANSAFNAANGKLSLSGGIVVGDITVTGNLFVNGTETIVNTSSLTINDPIFLLANNNTTNAVGLGFVAHYGATQKHTGLIRAHQDNNWYLFDEYDNHILYANNVLDVANVKLATLRANVNANSLLLVGNAVATQANLTLAHNQANTARSDANTTFGTINTTFGTVNTNIGLAYNQANAAYAAANTKLNSSSYTASDVLSKLVTVDGSGSGLDADTLDGVNSTGFYRTGTENSTLVIRDNRDATNYYSQVALEIRSSNLKAIIGLHRDGHSHCGISHEAANQLRFNFNAGDAYLNHNTGTIWGSGNDGSGSGLDADLWDGYQFADYLNQAVKTTSTPTFTGLTVSNTISGSVSGNAGTVGGVGITNIVSGTNSAAASDAISNMNDLAQKSGFYLYNSPTNAPEATWNTWLTAMGHYPGDRYGWQITQAYWSDALWTRRLTNNSWQSWRKILDSGNYTSYALSNVVDGWRATTDGYGRFYFANAGRTYYKSPNGHEFRKNTGDALTAVIDDSGNFLAVGNVTAYYSDARLKEFKGKIDNALDKVSKLNGYYYVENELAKHYGYNNNQEQVGVSAQEVEAVLPHIVTRAPFDMGTDESGNEYSKSGQEFKTVRYERLVPLLIEAIKELKQEIEELKKR